MPKMNASIEICPRRGSLPPGSMPLAFITQTLNGVDIFFTILSRIRAAHACIGVGTFSFYCKADARDILPSFWQRYADHANYLQHRILVGGVFWHVDDETNQFTLLKLQYLRDVVGRHNIRPILREMQRSGLIQRDRHWIEGEKSYGYRIGDKFNSPETIPHRVSKPVTCMTTSWP